jgi:exodeoxyribonuclease-5
MILNDDQYRIYKEAINWFKSPSSPQVFQIDGLAGTGKSVLIFEILRGLNLTQDQYMPMAYTGQASIVMRTKGFHTAKSIHSSLYEIVEEYDTADINAIFGRPRKKKIFRKIPYIDPNIRLFFIDEAYMVPDYMVKDILSFGVKVIVCGDQHQLPPIGGDPAFLTGPDVHHLTKLMRQSEDDPIIYLANRAINGDPIHCGTYGNSVMVINDTDFIPQMIGYSDIIISGTNKTRYRLNNFVRRYVGFNSPTPQFGERLICRNNNWNIQKDGIALANGLNGTVIKPPEPCKLGDKYFRIDFKPDLINTVFDDINVNCEYFTCSFDKKMEYRNNYDARQYLEGELFEFAYCITTHLSQGSEYNQGIFIEEFLRPQLQSQLLYTGITRFKKSLIYVKKTGKDINVNMRLS